MTTPDHIHWRDLSRGPGYSVIFCGDETHGFIHTGKAWRVTCPLCLIKLDLNYDASKVFKR